MELLLTHVISGLEWDPRWLEVLTPQEKEVTKQLIINGMHRSPHQKIANELGGCSTDTIKTHEKNIREKLQVTSRTGIILVALRPRLIEK